MTNLLVVGLEAQPHFPHEDLTDGNAGMLAVMLANSDFANFLHAESEVHSSTFRATHPAIFEAASRVIVDYKHTKALSYGAALFEAMSLLVQSYPQTDTAKLAIITAAFVHPKGPIEKLDYILEAEDILRTDLPRTAEVISEVSSRPYGALSSYAVAGAALTRHIELHAEASEN